MKSSRRIALTLALTGLMGGIAFAQGNYPSKPIRIIVPYPAGGLSDFQVRAISEPLGRLLGQPVIVDYRPGASGAIGTAAAAASPGDGYTFVFVNNGLVITPFLNKQAGYDPFKDFTPVALVSTTPMVMVTNPAVPANTVREFIDYVKAQPNGIDYGSAGNASFSHIATAMFSQSANVKMVHIPYKGEAPMTLALRSGEIKLLITSPSAPMMGAVKAGQLKLLGVASAKPAPLLPGIKQISDTVPGFTAEVWFGLFAPASTPPEVVAKFNESLAKVLASPDVREKFTSVGATAGGASLLAFGQMLRAESARWAEAIPKAGIKTD